jgi:mannose-1-phosphate guanylyltransferase/mannose-1-phosphate guanylyltransferase/mannose-6-phosphate isomerase
MFNDCLIMAGGSGTRLWPASNSRKPKQFLPVAKDDGESFFSLAVRRGLATIDGKDGRVIIIAGKGHIPHVIDACAKLPAAAKKHLVLIPEPQAKNTAPAIACAAVYAGITGGADRTMLVLTSDHIIKPLSAFTSDAETAAVFAAQGRLAVFGICPARPETGYGYIETGKPAGAGTPFAGSVYSVSAFREKPDLAAAKKFVASKRFFWNSGMFAFSVAFMAGEFRRLAPALFRPFEKLKAPLSGAYTVEKGLRVASAWAGLDKAYRETESISFDYAVAEKCRQTVMVRAGFDWIDVGNWEEYAKLLGDTGSEVYRTGEGETSCFVDSDIPVALAGVEDLIVIIRSGKDGAPAAALVTRKGETQRVREIVEKLKKAGKGGLL